MTLIYNRRTLALVVLMTSLNCCIIACNKISTPKKSPNVVLISIDTLRADHLSCYGYTRKTSPNIDGLAQQGVLFANVFSQSPRTAPSHMTIMTSLYPDVHGIENWENNKPQKRLDDSLPTIAEVLRSHGYTTVAFTGGGNVHAALGFDKGFDIYKHHYLYGLDYTHVIDETIAWIDNNYRKKFFLFFHTYAVHDPYLPPSIYRRKFDPDYQGTIKDPRDKAPESWKNTREELSELRKTFWESVNKKDPRDIYFLKALYDGTINCMDEQIVGPLLKKLQDVGIYNNTMVIFTSDHGEAFNEHKNFLHNDLYKETLHVPLIIVYPKIIPENVKIEQLVRLVDIMPTIFDVLDIDANMYMQGDSLLPAINKKDLNLSCYSTHNIKENFTFESIRTKEYSYIFKNWPKHTYQHLYDISKDPNEKLDIRKNKPEIVNKLIMSLSRMKTICKKLNTQKSSKEVLPDPETIKKLKTLGYLQ